MKTWETILRAVQQLPEAKAAAAKEKADWCGWGQRAAQARMEKGYKTHTEQLETHAVRETSVTVEASVVGPVKVVKRTAKYDASGDRVVKHVSVNKERLVPYGRSAVMQMNQYCRVLSSLDFTHEIVLTNAQRAYIEDVLLTEVKKYGKILMSVRRKDTGATALYIREGNKHIVLFEDGTTTKQEHWPRFDGSWFFNKKIKRTFSAEKPAGVMNADAKCFSLQAKPVKTK